jgi:hypothetical protein
LLKALELSKQEEIKKQQLEELEEEKEMHKAPVNDEADEIWIDTASANTK